MPATPAGYRRYAWSTADFVFGTALVTASPSGTVTAHVKPTTATYLAVFSGHPDDGGTQVSTGLRDANGASVTFLTVAADAMDVQFFAANTLPDDLWLVVANSGGTPTGTVYYRVIDGIGPVATRVSDLDGRVTAAETAATALTTRVTTDEGRIATLESRPQGVTAFRQLNEVDAAAFDTAGEFLSWDGLQVTAVPAPTGVATKHQHLIPISFTGVLTVGRHPIDVPNPFGYAVNVLSVLPTIGTPSAGASVIGDVEIGATSIFTTGNRPTIAAAAKTGTRQTAVSTPLWGTGATLVGWVDQVGSSTAGSDLVLLILVQEV